MGMLAHDAGVLCAPTSFGKGVVGTIGGGKAKPTGKIDIVVMLALSRQGEVKPLLEDYGQVIVDECHHVGAVSFDAILKRTKAKYVLGLTTDVGVQEVFWHLASDSSRTAEIAAEVRAAIAKGRKMWVLTER